MNQPNPLPTLSSSNYAFWYDSLTVNAHLLDAANLLTPNIPVTSDPAITAQHAKQANQLRQLIIPSLPPNVVARLPPNILRETPYQICEIIRAQIHDSNIENHEVLDAEARSTKYLPGTEFSKYTGKHLDIRQRMIAAQYPNIDQERTTVNYMLQGIANHPDLSIVAVVLAGKPPDTIQQFQNHVRQVMLMQEKQQVTSTPPPIIPHTTPPTQPQQRYTPRQPYQRRPFQPYPYRRHYRQPQQPGNHPRPKNWTGKWCSHHGSITHTTEQCYALHGNRRQNYPAHTMYDHTHEDFDPNNTAYDDMQLRLQQVEQALATNPPQHDQTNEGTRTYILDSGANPTHTHITHPELTPTHGQFTHTATGQKCPITHKGMVTITSHPKRITTNAICVPALKHNLLSVQDLTRHGHITFTPTKATLHQPTQLPSPLLTATLQKGLYRFTPAKTPHPTNAATITKALAARAIPQGQKHNRNKPPSNTITHHNNTPPNRTPSPPPTPPLQLPILTPPTSNNQSHAKTPTNLQLRTTNTNPRTHSPTKEQQLMHEWHLKLGHLRPRTISVMARHGLLPNLPRSLTANPPRITCTGCTDGKTAAQPHPRAEHTKTIGRSLSSDVCGPITPPSIQHNRYFMTLIDTASRYAFIAALATRSQVPTALTTTIEKIAQQRAKYPATITTDNAKEYTSKYVTQYLAHRGIQFRPTTPYTPQENAIAERINRTIMNSARAALVHSKLPAYHWENAVRDAVYKYNLSYHHSIKNIPYTLWTGTTPKLERLYIFGQLGTIPILKSPKTKLQTRAHTARYMYGIDPQHIRVLNLTTRKYQMVRATNFVPYHQNTDVITTAAAFAMKQRKQTIPQTITPTTQPPKTLKQARQYPDAEEWAKAHNKELDQLDHRKAILWTPTTMLPDRNEIIPMTMTYRYKATNDKPPQIDRKARCSVRGDMMQPHTNYDRNQIATFMAEKASIRTLLALAAAHDLKLEHFDITAAYLHEQYDHEKPVYIWQPPRFDGTYKHPQMAGQLKGNIYGTPPAAHIYTTNLHAHLKSHGYTQTKADPSMFHKRQGDGCIMIAVSMDDFLAAATTKELNDEFHNTLASKYQVKRLGPPRSYLNWNIDYTPTGLHISQKRHIAQVAKYLSMEEATPQTTPFLEGATIDPPQPHEEEDKSIATPFRAALGELRYIADCTRPDIAFAAAAMARATQKPTQRHWKFMKRTVRYLLATPSHGLLFPIASKNTTMEAYSDADFANDTVTRKSFSGNLYTINGASIHWRAKQQPIVAQSTCEAEYVAAAETARGTTWLRNLLHELGFPQTHPTTLHIDNASAIQIARKTAPTKRRKCIDIKYHLLQDLIHNNVIKVKHVASKDMTADILTKTMRRTVYEHLRHKLGVRPTTKTVSFHHSPTTIGMPPASQGDCDETRKEAPRLAGL